VEEKLLDQLDFDEDFLNRLWEKVDIQSDDDCWKWNACKNPQGYGLISYRYKNGRDVSLVASRVIYMLHNVIIPDKGYVYHTCKNSDCCNPKHLYLVVPKKINIKYNKNEIKKLLYDNIFITNNNCWEWQGTIRNQYGEVYYRGKIFKSHRLSYMLENNNFHISSKTKICHTCDNPKCINPYHLFAATQKENIYDMERKNRSVHPKGSENGNSKITEKKVEEIRNLYALKNCSQRELAEKYRVSNSLIGKIVTGEIWKHVSGEITILGKIGRYKNFLKG
jgi:predicted XRE-type DNA-binding protein